jgi:Holliday junction DNA helicase RuvA
LFGFTDLNEKGLFMHLISISGVGPSTALAFMSSLSVDEVKEAIVNEDAKTIQSIKGIGAKTAQRVILELKDKLIKEGFTVGSSSGNTPKTEMLATNKIKQEALEALVSLGIAKNIAEKSINTILKKEGNDLKVEQLIKLALKR